MLMNSIKKPYRELVGPTVSVTPIIAASGIREAANTSVYTASEMQERRLRRQRRFGGFGQGSMGWRVSAW